MVVKEHRVLTIIDHFVKFSDEFTHIVHIPIWLIGSAPLGGGEIKVSGGKNRKMKKFGLTIVVKIKKVSY